MRGVVIAACGLAVAGPAAAQAEVPRTFDQAMAQRFEIVSVATLGRDRQEHVITLEKADLSIQCHFPRVAGDSGSRDRRTHSLGVCTDAR